MSLMSKLFDGRTGLLLRSMLFWVIWFAIGRVIFLAYQWPIPRSLSAPLVAGAFWNGARMDIAAAAYLTTIPWLLLLLTLRASGRWASRLLWIYLVPMTAVVAVLTTVDLAVYAGWRMRLDATVLQFMRTPREMAASSASSPYVRLILLIIVLTVGTLWLLRRWLMVPARALQPARTAGSVALLAAGIPLFVCVRGGLQWTPINQSTVFFSDNDFANQVALNPAWTFADAVVAAVQVPKSNPYRRLAPNDARGIVDSLFASRGPTHSVLRVKRPNIILVVWESATAKIFSRLGGRAGVTPSFDSLAHEGILFDSVFASADRSAQGLVALESAYPALPHLQVVNNSHKIDTLPFLARSLGADGAGYHTSYYYGGELEFANLKAYIIASRFHRVVGEEAFAKRDRNSKWGAHDHVVYARQLHDMESEPRPFFSTIVTLSSHEPFEVPEAPHFQGTDEETQFLNAHHYADKSLGDYVKRLRQEAWWDSTLVIVIADHGHVLPVRHDGSPDRVPDRYHIPMLWLGGALAVRDTVVHTIGAQVDMMPTILAQLGIACAGCRWGKDLLRVGEPGFAYFAYHDGFGYVDRGGWVVYDVASGRTVDHGGKGGESQVRSGTALLQSTFDDFLIR